MVTTTNNPYHKVKYKGSPTTAAATAKAATAPAPHASRLRPSRRGGVRLAADVHKNASENTKLSTDYQITTQYIQMNM